jgi:deoxyribonuclease-4
MSKKDLLLGAHMSIAGGLYKAIERAESIGCTTMQIFTKSNKSWFAPRITDEDAALFKKTLKASQLSKVMVHTSYLINLGSKDATTRKKSIKALATELERCEQLTIPYLVLHPGAHVGGGEEQCMQFIAEGLDAALEAVPGKTKILLETAAGQGTTVGHTFEQLKEIRAQCHHKARVGYCLDTCHVFAAGYDLGSEGGYQSMWKEFDRLLGLNHLHAIHLNDSKKGCGCKLDRHEKIGHGAIPHRAFGWLMNDKRLQDIPFVLETPVEKDPLMEYEAEIRMLQKMRD